MEKFLFVLFIVIGIIGIVTPFFSRNKVQRYIKDRKGNLVSTEIAYPSNHKNQSLRVEYYDKHKNLRQVIYHENGVFSSFGDDEIIEYSKRSPEYKLQEKKGKVQDEKAQEYEKCVYRIKEGDLAIQQEFTQINKNEFVLLNGIKAPNGKYKLGFMNYIIVEESKVKSIGMF